MHKVQVGKIEFLKKIFETKHGSFMIKRRQKPQNLLKLDVSFLVLSVTCLVGTFLFYVMRLMEEHEEKVSQMFNQKRVFDKGFGFTIRQSLNYQNSVCLVIVNLET